MYSSNYAAVDEILSYIPFGLSYGNYGLISVAGASSNNCSRRRGLWLFHFSIFCTFSSL
jgi:hypothetical protein